MASISSSRTTFTFLCLSLLMTSLWLARRVPSSTLSLRNFPPTSSFAILGLQCSYWALKFTEIVPIAPSAFPRANSSPIFSRSMVYRIVSLYPLLSTLDVTSPSPYVPSLKWKTHLPSCLSWATSRPQKNSTWADAWAHIACSLTLQYVLHKPFHLSWQWHHSTTYLCMLTNTIATEDDNIPEHFAKLKHPWDD